MMKIPIFEELKFENYERDYLTETLKGGRIGRVPTFINLSHYTPDERKNYALILEKIFQEFKLNTHFPYPCYLIGDHFRSDFFPSVKHVKDLPDHFFKKIKRPNNREMQLLNKLSLKVEKINNINLTKVMDQLNETAYAQRKLYQESKELYFLENLAMKLFEKERGKNGKKN